MNECDGFSIRMSCIDASVGECREIVNKRGPRRSFIGPSLTEGLKVRRCELEILEVPYMYDGKSEGSQPCCRRCKAILVFGYLGKTGRCALRSDYSVYLTLEAGAVTEGPQISLITWACQQMKNHC